MAVFKNFDDLHSCMGRLYDDSKRDARIAPKIKDSNLVIQFRYDEPHATVTINAAAPPTQPGAYFDVLWGDDTGLKPDVEMSMKADVAHQFWHGKVNLMAALARRQIVAKGPIPKILKLLPAVEPMYAMYPTILHELGRDELIIK
ncbi:MAG TPA: SCP2 sterol-binding domain-containing protein [Roseiflexaceae bacterium]|nr:SCP2 sterol-binding domain-containing protein [Roseiflexaceae bacterium]